MAKKQTHTHTGECQVCGREQAISNDGRQWIAKHGYNVDHGFFNGTCWGADAQPIELSKDLLDEAIRRVEVQRESTQQWRANVVAMAGTLQGWYSIPVPKDDRLYGYKDEYKLFGEYFEVFTPWARQENPGTVEGYNKVMFRVIEEHIKRFNGKEFDPRERGYQYRSAAEAAKESQERTIKKIDGDIAGMTKYIAWQTERKKKWRVQQLKPVKREAPMPVFANGMILERNGTRYRLTRP